jgi:hypothetical protein
METLEIKKKLKDGYILRDEPAIESAIQKIARPCRSLNDLINSMEESGFPLQTLDQIQDCISKGAILYTKELIVSKADHKAINSLYGFVPEHSELIRLAPVPDQVKEAEAITATLQNGTCQFDSYNFEGGRFTVKPEVLQEIKDRFSRYPENKSERILIQRLKEIVDEFNTLRRDLIEYAPMIYQDSWTHPESLFKWEPFTKTYLPDIRAVVKIFDAKNQG